MMNFLTTTTGKIVGLVVLALLLCALYYTAYSTMGAIDKFTVNYDVVEQGGRLRRVPAVESTVVTVTPNMPLTDMPITAQRVQIIAPVPKPTLPENLYLLDDGLGSLPDNLCSRSCCGDQWPTSFNDKSDPFVCANKDKFVPSNIMCNNTFQDSGCMCLTKEQYKRMYQ